MDSRLASHILCEYYKRKLATPKWLDPNFIKQNNFITDTARFKAAQCTRRAGKSYGVGIYMFKEAYETPRVKVIYIALTRESAKRIMWDDILKKIDRDHGLKADFNASDLILTLPNGSTIQLMGANASPDDMNKILGQKFKLAVIDEAAMFTQDLKKLVYEILEPALIDNDGTMCLISTTSDILKSIYHDIVTGKENGWSVHKWSTKDNPYQAVAFQKMIDRKIQQDPNVIHTPHFKRMYLNEWYVDTDLLVYKFDRVAHTVEGNLPINKKMRYVLGIDLGWTDATAFSVCAYSEYSPTLYIVETYKRSKMLLSPAEGEVETDDNICVASKIKQLDAKYNFDVMVVDNASKQSVEELKQRHGVNLTAAEKTNKHEFIELMNADFITGKIKLLPGTEPLQAEYAGLVWDSVKRSAGKYAEHSMCANHLCDATLYAWRWCYNYAWAEATNPIAPQSEEAVDLFWQQEEEKLRREEHQEQWERDWT